MSTQQPGPARRRRIAGERRGRTVTDGAEPTSPTPPSERVQPAPAAERPVLTKKRPSSSRADAPSTASKAAATDVGSDEPAAGSRGGWWGSRSAILTLAGLLVVLLLVAGLAALGLLGTDGVKDVNEANDTERAMRTAPAAAEAAAAAILAYDYKSLDADQDAASRYMTDEFAEEYSDTFKKVVQPAAEQNRAKVTATVLASSAIRATSSTARVLLFVDQATVSRANEQPQVALNRVEMSMVREGGQWLVADISSY